MAYKGHILHPISGEYLVLTLDKKNELSQLIKVDLTDQDKTSTQYTFSPIKDLE